MDLAIHIIDYLYCDNKLEINDIVVDKDYIPQNIFLYNIDSSLTNKELYYFELLNDYMETLFNKITDKKHYLILYDIYTKLKSNTYSLHNDIKDLPKVAEDISEVAKDLPLDIMHNFKKYFICNEIIQTNINKFIKRQFNDKYKLICIYLLICNILKYYKHVERLSLNYIIFICNKSYNHITIDNILCYLKTCVILPMDKFTETNYNISTNKYYNYNKLITKEIILNSKKDIDRGYKYYDNFINNISAYISLNNKLMMDEYLNHQDLVNLIDIDTEINKNDTIFIPKCFVTYFDYLIINQRHCTNNKILYNNILDIEHINLIISIIIDKHMTYMKECNPTIFLTKLFDEILLSNRNFSIIDII